MSCVSVNLVLLFDHRRGLDSPALEELKSFTALHLESASEK